MNTLILASDGLVDSKYADYFSFLNDTFTFMFFIEFILKLIGYGVVEFCKSPINIFDGIIAILSLVDFIFSIVMEGGSNSFMGVIKVFRTIRVLRVIRLLR